MDIRINTSLQRIRYGLFESIKQQPFRELKNTDIIAKSEVSNRTFYRYFADKNELLEKIEDDMIDDLSVNLAKDRVLLENNQGEITDEINISANSFRYTLDYCAEKRHEILLLLSSNGDIGFWTKVRNLGRKELRIRFSLTGKDIKDKAKISTSFYLDNLVDCSINYVLNWLKNYDDISKNQISNMLSNANIDNYFG